MARLIINELREIEMGNLPELAGQTDRDLAQWEGKMPNVLKIYGLH